MSARPALLLAALALALAAPLAQAQWKWKDARGVVQYSDLPPPAGTPDRDILQRPAPTAAMRAATPAPVASAAAPAPAAPGGVDPELEARRKKAEQDGAAKKKVEEDRVAAKRAENCQFARSNLKGLEDGLRIARVNAKGEREFLDDQQRADEIRRTRELVAAECK